MKRFRHRRQGAAALEFAVLAFPLLLVTFLIIELSRALFMQQSLNHAVDRAARQVLLDSNQISNICDLVFEGLFLARRDRFDCVPPDPSAAAAKDYTLVVDYRFVSVVPAILTDIIRLRQTRVLVLGNF
jgi:hypothetical protein